ncbi:type IV pilus biogenesis protein PilM [Amedibacillus sp. YH-ame10]
MASENVVYISTNSIQLIQGSSDKSDMIKIHNFLELPLDEGTMINGVITDEAQILENLKTLKEQGVKHCRIVIDSGQILVKNVDVPALKKSELTQVVKNELSNLEEGYEDLIYDYSVLRNEYTEADKVGGEILCCAVERKLISSYLEVFENAGIKVDSIDISVNTLHKLTEELSDFEDKTFIVSVLDANNVSSYLFENNHYTFSNRSRMFSERGTPDFLTEMNSNISQLIQFNKSKRSPYPIEMAFFCGLEKSEEIALSKMVEENLEIQAGRFPDSKTIYVTNSEKKEKFYLNDYVYCVGCLIRK